MDVEVTKIKRGDKFQYETSPVVYIAIADESSRGFVRAYDPTHTPKPKKLQRIVRFNTNVNALTVIKEDGK